MRQKYKISSMIVLLVVMGGMSGKAQAMFYDLYSGMLNKKGELLILSKCGIVSADFILEFENTQLKDQLPDLTTNGMVQLHVKGKIQEKDGQSHLAVHDINRIAVGSSCKLLDVSVEDNSNNHNQ